MEIFCKKLGVACSALKEWEGGEGVEGEEVLRERGAVGGWGVEGRKGEMEREFRGLLAAKPEGFWGWW